MFAMDVLSLAGMVLFVFGLLVFVVFWYFDLLCILLFYDPKKEDAEAIRDAERVRKIVAAREKR
jgi:hypothetical protein